MAEVETCFVCSNQSDETCVNCLSVQYCSHHKHFHTDAETGSCYPFQVEKLPGVGRILLSTRDIQPGEIVFKEQEMVVGPCKTSVPVCIGCGGKVSGSILCTCSWPLCSTTCQELYRHSKEECEIISLDSQENSSVRCEDYLGILPLRVLLRPEQELDYFLQFMDHGEDRGEEDQDHLVNLIRKRWKQDQFSPELILRVEGILDINTVEHRVPGAESARGFLPITSLASHSCASNSIKDKTIHKFVITRARTKILKGEEITFHYTGGLKGRLMRRKALKAGWFFWCSCSRCSSPSEQGSEINTLICSSCSGLVRPVSPLEQESIYRCEGCKDEISAKEAENREQELTKQLESFYRNDTISLLKLLESSTGFHTNHFLRLIIKWLLITSWGREKGLQNSNLSESVLELKISLCREYLSALSVLDPGISHNRGLTLWELYSTHTFLLNKKFQEERVSPVKFLDGLEESLELVREASWCLQFNQTDTAEYRLRELALQAEENLVKTIQFFSSVLPK